MHRRKFSREFKVEAVKLIGERCVTVAPAARDLDASLGSGEASIQASSFRDLWPSTG